MATYLQRYLNGEHEVVWKDFMVLQEKIYHEEYYEDALAVTKEVIRRVKWNIQHLIQKLSDIGYIFGYGHRFTEVIQACH